MRRRLPILVAALAAAAVVLAGCGSSGAADTGSETVSPTGSSGTAAADTPAAPSSEGPAAASGNDVGDSSAAADAGQAAWPRTITHDGGTTTIDAQPKAVVSTSVTMTGILLAIGAPLTASAAATPGPLTDKRGFFTQWVDAADKAGVTVLYPNLTLDLEAVDKASPDLIVGSTIGQDNTSDAYQQLSDIAPTLLYDYGSQDWTSLATKLGEALGLEANATSVIADYEATLSQAAGTMTAPTGKTLMISYTGADGANVFNPSSAQAHVLTSLGFDYGTVDKSLVAQERSDISTVTLENLPSALADVDNLFVLKVGASSVSAVKADPLLANVKAIADGQLKELPPAAFRIDYYSGMDMAHTVAAMYAG